jgi:diguanylate cyclase (GGDEF)-like protein/PAS domain S-box-containing protein
LYPNEAARLDALRQYDVLDTLPEVEFDDLTLLAAHICGTPIALISLVDENRQWFKSSVGLGMRETPRDVSFCAHAIVQDDLFVVQDATQDERFADNPLVTSEPHIRFYMGAPLITPQGHALGTLCVVDRVPRQLSPQQAESLQVLSRQVVRQLELRRLTMQQQIALVESKQAEALLRAIRRVQSEFIADGDIRFIFQDLLNVLLTVTQSDYGFIGEILRTADGQPYLKTHALTNIAWDQESELLYEKYAALGFEFHNLNTLFGAVITSGQPVIANDPATDPRRGGLPPGHPPLDAFLGIPFYQGKQQVGMVGVANRSGGYSEAMVRYLEPFLSTCASIISAYRNEQSRQRAEEALQRAKEFSERLIQSSVDGILAFDSECRYTVWNAGMERISGVPASETLGKCAFDLFPFLKDIGEDRYFYEALAGRAAIAQDRPYTVPATGRQGFFEGHYSPLRNESGEVIGGLALIRDITQRKQAEKAVCESEEKHRLLLNSIESPILALQEDMTILYCNNAYAKFVGKPIEELEGRDMGALFPGFRQTKSWQAYLKVLETGEPQEVEGTLEDHHLRAWIYRTPWGILSIAEDVTERKQSEEALRRANDELTGWVKELEQRNRATMLLNEMGDLLQACITHAEAYTVIAQFVEQLFPEESGAVCMINASYHVVEAVAAWGESSLNDLTLSPDDCWALRRGRLHWAQAERQGLRCQHLNHSVAGDSLCVPMMAQGKALGVLHLYCSAYPSRNLSEEMQRWRLESQQRLAMNVAENIALAIANLRLRETLRAQSIRDPLTALFNRRYMEESLEREMHRAVRKQRPLGVIMLDLDHFKQFNDTFGHEAGNALLRAVGDLLQTHTRKDDIACRYGGEEFMVILPEATLDVARQRAETLREAVSHLSVQHGGKLLGTITVSLGVAAFPEHGEAAEDIVQAADTALYRAKDEGRNCVVVATEDKTTRADDATASNGRRHEPIPQT